MNLLQINLDNLSTKQLFELYKFLYDSYQFASCRRIKEFLITFGYREEQIESLAGIK